MYTNEELINKIKDIISNQLIVKEAEYPYAFTLQTGVSKKIEFPNKLSVFDIFTPNRTLDTTPVMLTLKTKKHIANLATPDNKGVFTITSHGDGSYKVRLAKNKEGKIVSILIIYD